MMQQEEVDISRAMQMNILRNLGTENTVAKEYGCIGQTAVILFSEYHRNNCHHRLGARTAYSGNVHHWCQVCSCV